MTNTKYKVKRLCSKGKNSFYTISPGVYEASSEPQEVWDYLLKLGPNCIEVIEEKSNCPISISEPETKIEISKPRRKPNLNIKEENEKENI